MDAPCTIDAAASLAPRYIYCLPDQYLDEELDGLGSFVRPSLLLYQSNERLQKKRTDELRPSNDLKTGVIGSVKWVALIL